MNRYLMHLLIIAFFLLLGCSGSEKTDTESIVKTHQLLRGGILINNDDPYTNKSHVTLQLLGPEDQENTHMTHEMYITEDPTCESGGEWSLFSETKDWILSTLNTKTSVYARFRNSEGHVSKCVSDDIIHDDVFPQVDWREVPLFAQSTHFEFAATDELSGLDEVRCYINVEYNVDCQTGQRFQIDPLQRIEGQNEIVVDVFDKAGNMSSLYYQWEIDEQGIDTQGVDEQGEDIKQTQKSLYRSVSQSFFVKELKKKVDILFVIDDSSSMYYEHQSLAKRLSDFFDHLVNLDWRIAVTSTNPNTSDKEEASDGKLAPFPNGEYYIDYTLEDSLAMDYLSETVVMDIHLFDTKADCEQGIRGTYRAIERIHDAANQGVRSQNKKFFRKNAELVVILLSDEDECKNKEINQPRNLIHLVRNTWGLEKEFIFHSIIVRRGDRECLHMSNIHAVGTQYSRLSLMTNGVIGSVCATDYADQLKDIGYHVKTLSIPLECSPLDDIVVQSEDGIWVTDFTFDEATQLLHFPESLLEATYSVDYNCSLR